MSPYDAMIIVKGQWLRLKGYVHTYRFDDYFSLQVVHLLVVEIIFQVPINGLQFLIHITLRVLAEMLDSQSMTYGTGIMVNSIVH